MGAGGTSRVCNLNIVCKRGQFHSSQHVILGHQCEQTVHFWASPFKEICCTGKGPVERNKNKRISGGKTRKKKGWKNTLLMAIINLFI